MQRSCGTKKTYLARRHALIAKDGAARLDSSDRDDFASDASCDKADALVRQVRDTEAASVWGPESVHVHGEGDATHLFPGMAFLTGEYMPAVTETRPTDVLSARDIIVKTRLFKIMSQVC